MAGLMLKALFCLWAALMLSAPSPALGARSLRQVATGMLDLSTCNAYYHDMEAPLAAHSLCKGYSGLKAHHSQN